MKNLTKRETEIMKLLAKGFMNKEIAVKLGITESTIKNHFRIIFSKLKVRNRVEALLKWQRIC
jgi:DNA-binding NarL/FixJ family response regulator